MFDKFMVYRTVYTDTFPVSLDHKYARFSIRGLYCLQKGYPWHLLFLLSIRTSADKMSVLEYKKRGNNFRKHRKTHIAQ